MSGKSGRELRDRKATPVKVILDKKNTDKKSRAKVHNEIRDDNATIVSKQEVVIKQKEVVQDEAEIMVSVTGDERVEEVVLTEEQIPVEQMEEMTVTEIDSQDLSAAGIDLQHLQHENIKMYPGNKDRYKKVDKDDPRSRLHYVKYMKKDGKTMKLWECGICSKEFRHQYTLMRHLPTHTDERNYKCETCGKAFRQMSTLSQHRAIHTDARPYVCEFCQKTFNRVSTLISHRKIHTEEKPHKCEICGRGFHQKGNLRNHIYTHTNERPYRCDVCGKGFNQTSNLVCHKLKFCNSGSITQSKAPFICSICHKEFPRRFALKTHEEYKHGIKYFGTERRKEFDPGTFQEIVAEKFRREKQRTVRIIQLPNGDKTLADIRDINRGKLLIHNQQNLDLLNADMLAEEGVLPSSHDMMKGAQSKKQRNFGGSTNTGVLVDPIETKAMQNARSTGQTPFALLKPAKGIPVLVKVLSAIGNKQMLVPATAEDLRNAGKITVSPSLGQANGNSIKAVQIKVPVVATVIQKVSDDGQVMIEIEPPGPETAGGGDHSTNISASASDLLASNIKSSLSNHVEYNQESLCPSEPITMLEEEEDSVVDGAVQVVEEVEGNVQYMKEDGTIVSASEIEHMNPVDVLASAVDIVDQHEKGDVPQMEQKVQYLQQSSDGSYQVLTEDEAQRMIAADTHSFQVISELQVPEESSNNLSSLVDALQTASEYEVGTDSSKNSENIQGEEMYLTETQ